MRINDLFNVISSQEDIKTETKKNLYKTVRLILKYYKTLDLSNDMYDVWNNEERIAGYLRYKGHDHDAELLGNLFDLSEVDEYVQECIEEEEPDDDTESEADNEVSFDEPQKIDVTVDVVTGWPTFVLLLIGTLNIGISSYLLFRQYQQQHKLP